MIIDLTRFINEERGYWKRLDAILERLSTSPHHEMGVEEVREFHYLYQRASSALAKIATFSSEPETRRYLESLLARAYGEIHETREKGGRFAPFRWFFGSFPRTVRRHLGAFWLSVGITLAGFAFGGAAVTFDPDAKEAILPFAHLQSDPSDRVAREESAENDRLRGQKAAFSSYLMTHNIQVSIFALALGITWGVGTVILLLYNGVILGAVAVDYVAGGETPFLIGWLLPHGAVEIPAILIAGQAGLVLASALVGWGDRTPLRTRLGRVSRSLVNLICGVGVFLIWAGLVEAFLSQYHEPLIPYGLKIALGVVELALLIVFLAYSGRTDVPSEWASQVGSPDHANRW